MQMLAKRRRSAAWLWWGVPIVAVGGWFYPYLGLGVLACMIAPVLVGVWRGRHWCGWFCPRGAFFDYIMARFPRRKAAPAWLRTPAFRVAMLIFLMGMMTVQMVMAWPNPAEMARVFVVLLGVTTLAGIALSLAYSPRAWCTFCPMGTMASWVSHGKRPLKVSASCRDCSACAKACPMNLTPHKPGHAHADCVKCTRCVERCPVKALGFEGEAEEKVKVA